MIQEKQKWHIGKEVPLATIVVLLLQTAGALWWAAQVAAKVEYLERAQITNAVSQATIDRKQDEEAKRSEDRILAQLDKLSVKMDRLMEKGDRH